MLRPRKLDLKKDRGLSVEWEDGSTSYYTVPLLRKLSPAADARQLREEMESNPLAVLPADVASSLGRPLRVESAELVGNYAIRFVFSDGHDAGIYSWDYLLSIDPTRETDSSEETSPDSGGNSG